MIDDNNNKAIYDDANTINFREFFEKFAFHWKWFSLGVITMLALAFLYLKYTPRQYKVSATILVNDKNWRGAIRAFCISGFRNYE